MNTQNKRWAFNKKMKIVGIKSLKLKLNKALSFYCHFQFNTMMIMIVSSTLNVIPQWHSEYYICHL